jgi:hypothetical protein
VVVAYHCGQVGLKAHTDTLARRRATAQEGRMGDGERQLASLGTSTTV